MLSIEKNILTKDGKRFFYLADTCWSAFTNISLEDWNYYLDYRVTQGFNVVQINVLKQWDSSGTKLKYSPFPFKKEDRKEIFDFSKLNEDYFDRAEKMLEMVKSHGMTPALVLLWSNYVPDTWAANVGVNNQISYEEISNYISYVVKRFRKFHPIYFISGDTDFPTKKTIDCYDKALETAKAIDPKALYTFHIKGRLSEVPEKFLNSMDFFSYQSGHNFEGQHTAYSIPLKLRKMGFSKPIINTEPCYEQISYSRNLYGRYTARDVRKASWSAVLSGADAGITYGAHGIWSWHTKGQSFGIVEGEGFDSPFDWRNALHFRGADDISYLKNIMLRFFRNGIFPLKTELKDEESIRIGANKEMDRFAIYLPVNTEIDISSLGLSKEKVKAMVIDLEKRKSYELGFKNSTQLELSRAEADSLILLDKKG
ncbi:DUF4038 domain-containing protein [Pediococcus acidilactici]|uniref:apiosidase-like domain-containing protein n=1 Tax=Pediococcus acidilactici TaxID=1254 RepID=UPI0022E89DF9|nr:DUF4038 domain-containing protein [Pediococcus acidilactici]